RTMRDLDILFILPLAPAVRARIIARLDRAACITLADPMPYPACLARLAEAELVLTDSGGVREAAPALGVPTECMRNECDRQEACAGLGTGRAATDAGAILAAAVRLLATPAAGPALSPDGDGQAARRIAAALAPWRLGSRPLLPAADCFAG